MPPEVVLDPLDPLEVLEVLLPPPAPLDVLPVLPLDVLPVVALLLALTLPVVLLLVEPLEVEAPPPALPVVVVPASPSYARQPGWHSALALCTPLPSGGQQMPTFMPSPLFETHASWRTDWSQSELPMLLLVSVLQSWPSPWSPHPGKSQPMANGRARRASFNEERITRPL